MKRTVQDWFKLLRENNDDQIARRVLDDLIAYQHYPNDRHLREDELLVATLITAIRLDQMAKENS